MNLPIVETKAEPIVTEGVGPCLLYCHCAYAKVIPAETKRQVLEALCRSDLAFEAVPDLCEMSARKDPALERLSKGGALRIAACFPRAVKWLFASAEASLDEDRTEVLNMREMQPEQVIAQMMRPKGSPAK